MSIRTLLFCDVCNLQGTRYPELRRDSGRRGKAGRRTTDGRASFEGTVDEALESSWIQYGSQFVCPGCAEKSLRPDPDAASRGESTFAFCDRCNSQGFRFVESRRYDRLDKTGRRFSDGRAWLDLSQPDAYTANNWVELGDKQYCPVCASQTGI